MIPSMLVAALSLSSVPGQRASAGDLPVCANRVINEVVRRSGCTVGDARCWTRSGGFCTDFVEKAVRAGRREQALELSPVRPETVQRGDVAVFASRVHYALVEKVIRDRSGAPVAVDLTEYNFGTCWVDEQLMVTDQYKVLNRRTGVPLGSVDGGFLRAGTAGR